jgi:putative ABC transport system permease protein
MNPLAGLPIAFAALRSNKLRSLLTMLGIIIGVAAVIIMVAIGTGTRLRIAEQIERLGANLLMIIPGTVTTSGARMGAGTRPTLTQDDLEAIEREIDGVAHAGAIWWTGGQAIYGASNWSTRIHGVTPGFLAARDWGVIAGRQLDEDDVERVAKVAFVGRTVVEKLFGEEDPLGKSIRLRNVPFTVAGVLESKGQNLQGQDQDDIIYVPLTTARNRLAPPRFAETRPASAITGRVVANNVTVTTATRRTAIINQVRVDTVSAILVKAVDAEAVKFVDQDIAALLRERHRINAFGPDDFQIRDLSEVARAQQAAAATMAAMLATIAGVSLLVGGIGIMNIMLVSVTERRKEIGLRMAVGARRRDILRQFLVEAVALALIGGVVGIILGVFGSSTAASLVDVVPVVEPVAIIVSFVFSGLVGIVFGYYPALRAAKLDPIVALTHE